jgi:hypothetical protein
MWGSWGYNIIPQPLPSWGKREALYKLMAGLSTF